MDFLSDQKKKLDSQKEILATIRSLEERAQSSEELQRRTMLMVEAHEKRLAALEHDIEKQTSELHAIKTGHFDLRKRHDGEVKDSRAEAVLWRVITILLASLGILAAFGIIIRGGGS
jgi:hypothetical protein